MRRFVNRLFQLVQAYIYEKQDLRAQLRLRQLLQYQPYKMAITTILHTLTSCTVTNRIISGDPIFEKSYDEAVTIFDHVTIFQKSGPKFLVLQSCYLQNLHKIISRLNPLSSKKPKHIRVQLSYTFIIGLFTCKCFVFVINFRTFDVTFFYSFF